jgi:VCBS repeat-containing protein
MSSSRGRNDVSLLSFALQDFGALSSLRDGTALQAIMSSGVDRMERLTLAPHSASVAQGHDWSMAPAHGVAPLVLGRHVYTAAQATQSAAHHDNGYDTSPDHTNGGAGHVVPANGASSVFAPSSNLPAIAQPQIDVSLHQTAFLRGSAPGSGHEIAASHGVVHNAPPPVAAVGGQLWYGDDDLGGHTGLNHIDTDAAGTDVADNTGVTFASMGLDGADGLYFGYTRDGLLRDGHITNDVEGGTASQIASVDMVFGSGVSADEVNAIAVDPLNHIIFVGLWGQTDQYTGILEVQYNPATGALTSPYNAATGVVTDFSHMLFDDNASGKVNGVTSMTNIIAMQYDMQDGDLYYVDQTNIWAGSSGSNVTWAQVNGIFKVSTTGNVTSGEPTPVQLSLNSQFAAGDNNNYIEGLAINEAQGIIYFAVNNASNSTSKLFWMPITGGTATQMFLPGGVPAFFVDDEGTGVNPLSFDPILRELFVSDNSHSQICQLTLSADGKSFTGGNADFYTIDHSNPGTGPTGQYFDPLPTLSSLSATTTEALQGGSALTLLTAAPTVTDAQDGASIKLHMGFMQIVIANAQTGDNLFYSGAQSGTFDSGKMTISWNSATHTLTLTGNETEAAYDTFFQNVTFQDSGTDNSVGSHPTRTIDWIISDGTTIVDQTTADANEHSTTVVIDRAPTVVADSYPVVESATVSGTSGTGGTGVLGNDSDKDADAIAVSQVNGSAGNVGNSVAGTYGHLTLNSDGSFSYVADITSAIDGAATGSHPIDTFTYQVTDGLGGLTTGTVSFTIDRPPTVVADNPSGEALEGGAQISGNVLTNDSDKDGDALTVSQVNGSAGNVGASVAGTYGHMKINSNGSYTYSADNTAAIDGAATGSHLTDSFSYQASDGHGGTTSTTITVTIDRAPTVVADNGGSDAVESGSAVVGNVLTNDSDRDGDSLTVSAVNGVAGNVGNSVAGTYGHITINSNGSYSYTADNTAAIDGAATGSHLTDSFTYTASDGQGGTTSTTVTFTIDRAPTVTNDSNNTSEGGSLSVNTANGVLANDSDRDGDPITISAVSGSAANVGTSTATTYGHITLNADGSYSYTADNTAAIDGAASGSHPVDTITFTVSDGFGGFTNETLSITLDRPAVATADSLNTNESTQAISGSGGNPNLLANDNDPDGDSITITAVNGSGANVGTQIVLASGALLTVNADGTYTYDPNHAFDYLPDPTSGASNATATDTFTYTVDGGSTVTVTVTVTGQDSNDTLIGTSGNDTLHAGIGNDIIYDDNGLMSGTDPHDTSAGKSGGTDTFTGDAGNDIIYMGGNLTASDQIDGGTGTDIVVLNGDYSGGLVFNATTMVNVESLNLTAGHSYNLTMDNATVAAGQTLGVHGGMLGAGDVLIFDGSADTTGGNFIVNGGAGNDILTGGNGNDLFRSGAGVDTIQGGGGNDRVDFLGNFTAADSFNGGAGDDTVRLQGDYSGGVTLGATTWVSVEKLELVAGHSYNLTMNAATVAAGDTLTVLAGALVAANSVTFDGSADSGNFVIYSGAGNDVLTGGSGNDFFHPGVGNDTIHAGGGDDVISMVAGLTAADSIDGGSGNDTVYLNGNYSGGVTFTATTMTNIERVTLEAGHSYNLTIDNATVAAGQTMTFAGDNLGAADSFVFDGSHDTSGGALVILGGAGNDTLTGGSGNDLIEAHNGTNIITGGGGADTLYGGSGADTFVYNSVTDSTSTGFDRVKNFDANSDFFKITGMTVNAVDAAVNGGHLSGAHFDTDLAAAVGSGQLAAHDAVLFTASSGNLSGHTFLVVDINGVAGYQAGQDLVIDVTGGSHLTSLSATNFIG